MYLERKQDLSICYWLTTLLGAVSTSIKVVDGFPKDPITLPTVSVEAEDIRLTPRELGNRTGKRERVWSIDIFAKNKAQRDEMMSAILDDIENGILVYDYDLGFPPTPVPQLGTLRALEIEAVPIHMFEQMMENLYWRATIRFLTEYSAI
jgi:hypothetical protein